jgi:hypothetical protein
MEVSSENQKQIICVCVGLLKRISTDISLTSVFLRKKNIIPNFTVTMNFTQNQHSAGVGFWDISRLSKSKDSLFNSGRMMS